MVHALDFPLRSCFPKHRDGDHGGGHWLLAFPPPRPDSSCLSAVGRRVSRRIENQILWVAVSVGTPQSQGKGTVAPLDGSQAWRPPASVSGERVVGCRAKIAALGPDHWPHPRMPAGSPRLSLSCGCLHVQEGSGVGRPDHRSSRRRGQTIPRTWRGRQAPEPTSWQKVRLELECSQINFNFRRLSCKSNF